jgi:UDPglucose 6-dehydrogenase
MKTPVIGFAGLSHLGLCSAVAAAARGFRTLGYDPDAQMVVAIAEGRMPVAEPDLDRLAREHKDRFSVHAEPQSLGVCDIVYIARDVPTDDSGGSDLAPVRRLIAETIPHLKPTALLVILCQVPPGFTRGIDFDRERLFYQVETLIFGRAMERAQFPERFMIGAPDPTVPLPETLHSYLSAFACPILPMRIESAELAKISINMFLVASVSVTNTLAELAAGVGADWRDIAPALRLDKRIGPHAYLQPGLGISGGNLERDLASVVQLAARHGSDAGVIRAFIADSAYRRDWMVRTLLPLLAPVEDAQLGLLGIAYKEDTHSTKNSPGLWLAQFLTAIRVAAYDPRAILPVPVPTHMTQAATIEAACDGADAVVIATAWPDFRALSPDLLLRLMRGRILVDPYGLLDGHAFAEAGFAYHTLGRDASHA